VEKIDRENEQYDEEAMNLKKLMNPLMSIVDTKRNRRDIE
jgi:hypothetical protein